jgi:hypothetical protein
MKTKTLGMPTLGKQRKGVVGILLAVLAGLVIATGIIVIFSEIAWRY